MIAILSLLRGVNVSGQKIIKMADLKVLYESLGLESVKTYIQSGNVVFACEESREKTIAAEISAAIKKSYGFDVPVQTFTLPEWRSIATEHPLMNVDPVEEKMKYVTLLGRMPEKEKLAALAVPDGDNGTIKVVGKTIYLSCPSGYGRTKLSNNFFESKLKVQATSRNWRSTQKLLNLLQDVPV
ncbi:MAG: DUF1697 domain-containing protein [Calditrichia bacterium]